MAQTKPEGRWPAVDLNRYRFSGNWRLGARRERVYAVLREPDDYARWWPQIRLIRRVDEESGELVARSFLPYDLFITATRGVEDAEAGTLQANLGGDLEGWFRWTVRADGRGTRVDFDQDVVVRRPLLRRLSPLARPVLVANHTWMMRGGRRGLARHLAGRESGCGPQTPPGQ
ncbi:polyketide cyclase [Wenjunlia tyrosinilytica]|uniref:Polyketide cyclase n=1 Tax=Wenjunlia tyrosinilytica TaxID=1544741 RepID=A0A917ZL53_9ACTN|nr:polyketide cyclase [Wenjunlia tyrosinilytica]GGO84114.1 polyketide cyclase [Wenjunlia tyrosinilytica]